MSSTLNWVSLPVVPYGQALALQHQLRDRLIESDDGAGWVLTLEHPPTVTLGKRGTLDALAAPHTLHENDVEVFQIDRGGEATYHGPGQLVIYPVLRLNSLGLGVVDLIRGLADSISKTLESYGVSANYDADHPGVWTDDAVPRKIASVGMRVSRGVTTHGAAVNLTNEMLPFTWIVPCGMPNAPMACLCDISSREVSVAGFTDELMSNFKDFLGCSWRHATVSMPASHTWSRPVSF